MKPQKVQRVVAYIVFIILLSTVAYSAQTWAGTIIVDTAWPMLQHDAYHTGQSSLSGITFHPIEIWKTQLPTFSGTFAPGMSVGMDGIVYASAAGNLYALNPQNGDIEWHFPYEDRSRSTPAIGVDGTIYWGYGDSFVAITTTGQVEWGWTNLTGNYVFGSSPVIDEDNNIYFNHDGIWSLTHEGDLRWFYPSYHFSHSSPAMGSDGTIYAATDFNEFVALRPDGTLKWSIDVEAYDNSPALASDGTIYVGILNGEAMPAKLLALNPDGTTKWTFLLDNNIYSIHMPPAIATDGTIYFGSGSNHHPTDISYFYALNPDGTLKWKLPFRSKDDQDWPPFFTAPPVIDKDGNIYVCPENGSCYGLSPGGTILWEVFFPVDITGYPVVVTTAPLVVSDGFMLILDDHGFVHAFVEPTGIAYLPAVFKHR